MHVTDIRNQCTNKQSTTTVRSKEMHILRPMLLGMLCAWIALTEIELRQMDKQLNHLNQVTFGEARCEK